MPQVQARSGRSPPGATTDLLQAADLSLPHMQTCLGSDVLPNSCSQGAGGNVYACSKGGLLAGVPEVRWIEMAGAAWHVCLCGIDHQKQGRAWQGRAGRADRAWQSRAWQGRAEQSRAQLSAAQHMLHSSPLMAGRYRCSWH